MPLLPPVMTATLFCNFDIALLLSWVCNSHHGTPRSIAGLHGQPAPAGMRQTWPTPARDGTYVGAISLIPAENRMDRLASMETFVRVVETGSFSGAARQLRVGQP